MRRTKLIGYGRVSTLGQSLDGHSLANQRARIEAYVAAYPDLELVGIECDEGVSAASLSRPALDRAFEMLRANRAGAMLVVEMSRLTRSVRDLQTVIEFFTGRRALLGHFVGALLRANRASASPVPARTDVGSAETRATRTAR